MPLAYFHIRICLNKCTMYILLESQCKNYFLYQPEYETRKKEIQNVPDPFRSSDGSYCDIPWK